jgi:pimeloyl-ACP methyl ester carboxylesterase
MKLRQRIAIGLLKRKIKFYALFSKKKAAKVAFKAFCTPDAPPPKISPIIYQQSKRVKFMLDGKKIRGHRWNHPQDNKVLILHGFSSAAYKFDKYVISLINKGYEVIAFDAPAHGRSQGRTTNAVEYKEMIKKVIYKFGPINKFLAHSFGGIALSLALEEMEHDENTRVALIAPVTETKTSIDIALKTLHIRDKKIRKEIDTIIHELSGNPTEWFSIRRALLNISAKILWVHDEDDHVTPLRDVLKVQEKHFPNVEFVFTKGLGHHNIYTDNVIKSNVTEFL